MTLRISIATALLVIGLFAAILAGFRFGVDRGREVAAVELDQAEPRSGRYDLSGISFDSTALGLEWPGQASPAKGDLVSKYIQENFAPEDWEYLGGPFRISYDRTADELHSFCRGSTHAMIATFLDELENDSSRLTDITRVYHEKAEKQHKQVLAWEGEKLSHADSMVDGSIKLGATVSKFVGPFRNEAFDTLYNDVSAFVFYPDPNTANPPGGMFAEAQGFVQLIRSRSNGAPSRLKFSMANERNLSIGNKHFVVGSAGDDLILVLQNDPGKALRLKPMDSVPGEQ